MRQHVQYDINILHIRISPNKLRRVYYYEVLGFSKSPSIVTIDDRVECRADCGRAFANANANKETKKLKAGSVQKFVILLNLLTTGHLGHRLLHREIYANIAYHGTETCKFHLNYKGN